MNKIPLIAAFSLIAIFFAIPGDAQTVPPSGPQLSGSLSSGGGGSGSVSAGTAPQAAYYAATGTTVSGNSDFLFQPTGSFQLYRNQNDTTGFDVKNTTSGASAIAEFRAGAGGADYLAFGYGSPGYVYSEFADRAYLSAGTNTLGTSYINGAGDVRWYEGSPPTATEVMRLSSSGNLGIGTTTTTEKLNVFDGTLARVTVRSNADSQVEMYSGNAAGGSFSANVLYTSRGSNASPTALQSGDTLAGFYFGGYNGSFYTSRANILSKATENWGGSASGSNLIFSAGTTGAATSTETLRMSSSDIVFNENSSDINTRIESNGNANAFVVDGGLDCTGVGAVCGAGIGASFEVYNNSGDNIAVFGASAGATQSIIGANDVSGTIGALWLPPRSVGASIGTLPSCNSGIAGAQVYIDDTNDSKPGAYCNCVGDSSDVYSWKGYGFPAGVLTDVSCPP